MIIIRFLSLLVIIIVFFAIKLVHSQELTDEEYAQFKNRLTAEFVQKLKEEIKGELIEELKAEYTIEPKQATRKSKTNVVTDTATQNKNKSPSSQSPAQKTNRDIIKKNTISENVPLDVKQNTECPSEDTVQDYIDTKENEDETTELERARYKLGEGLTFGEQLLVIRGFGNVDARYVDHNVSDDITIGDNFFSLGEFDLFMTSKLSNRISFLNETVFEFDQSEEVEIDIERLLIHYDINNLLKIDVGKFYLPIGYWIPTYNHGFWFQTTMDRPDIVNFQDKGGPLPTHDTGIKLWGNALLEGFDLNYACAVSNGRGVNTTQQQRFGDINDKKALSAQIDVQPHIVEGLRLGPSIYYDVIPEDNTNPDRKNEIREIIYGGHVIYTIENIELLTEVFEIDHDEYSGSVSNTLGGYAQFAYIINKFKPYYRYDYINYDSNDTFYRESKFDFLDTNTHTIGLRYELSHFNALKFEYSHGTIDDEDVNIIGLQTAFSF